MKISNRNSASKSLLLALIILVYTSPLFAITLRQYRDKINDAKESLDVLLYLDDGESNEAENREYEARTLKNLRANFPATEKVEWGANAVEVENGWISEKLRAYENEKDSIRRAAILTEISQLLGAVEAKIDELERAEKAVRSKDEDKRKLAEILRRAEYQKPEEKQESFLQRMWREFKEWLAKMFPKPKTGVPSAEGFQSFSYVLQLVIFALVFGVIGYLIYRFAPFLAARFRDREKKDKGARVILGERLAADETSTNLFSEAEKLAGEGKLREAIRKGYIALLCELSDRKVIGLAQHKTNRDYLRDVRKTGELHRNMSGLTGSFERHWYGAAQTEEKDWEEFKNGYKQTVKS